MRGPHATLAVRLVVRHSSHRGQYSMRSAAALHAPTQHCIWLLEQHHSAGGTAQLA